MIDGNIDVVSLTGDITDSVSLEGELLPIGPKGDKGDPGFSPVVTTSKSGKTTTVKFETATGNVYAYIQDGEDGQGSGDMLKEVYDANNNGIVDNAEKVNNHTVEKDVPANADFSDTKAIWGNITGTLTNQTDLNAALGNKANTSDLSTVATSGSYNDLSNKPTNVSTFTNDANYVTSNGNAESTQSNVSSATFTNTLEAPMDIDLKGNTLQNGTPTPSSPIPINNVSGDNQVIVCGKNLVDVNNSVYGAIITNDTTGVLDNVASHTAITSEWVPCKPNTTYIISGQNNRSRWQTKDINGTITFVPDNSTITTNSTAAYMRVYYYYNGTPTQDISSIKIQLEEGNQATTYEAYNGTTYNIDLPVENLFDKDTMVYGEIYYLPADVNNTQLRQMAGGGGVLIIKLKEGATYTISKRAGARFRAGFTTTATPPANTNNVITSRTPNNDNGTSITFVVPNGSPYFVCNYFSIDQTLDAEIGYTNMLNSIQIEQGNKANSYTPYGTTPIELNKIGTYQDYFYKENDKWYLHKEIKKHLALSSEVSAFGNPGVAGINGATITLNDMLTQNYGDGLSNYFFNKKSTKDAGTIRIGGNDRNVYLYVNANTYPNTQSFKDYLDSNNVYIYYILETPINIEITYQPLINQLNAIFEAQSKEGTTNVNQVNNDAPFILDLSVFNDTYNGRYESLVEQIPNNDNLVNVGTYVNDNYKVNMLYSHNLFNKNNVNVLNAYFVDGTNNITADTSGNNKTIYIPCKPNTTYTIQKTVSPSNRAIGYTTTIPAVNVAVQGAINILANTTTKSITTGNNAEYLVIRVWSGTQDTITFQEMLDSVMINEGSEALPYEPYIVPSINVDGEEIYNAGKDIITAGFSSDFTLGTTGAYTDVPTNYAYSKIGTNFEINNNNEIICKKDGYIKVSCHYNFLYIAGTGSKWVTVNLYHSAWNAFITTNFTGTQNERYDVCGTDRLIYVNAGDKIKTQVYGTQNDVLRAAYSYITCEYV